MRHRLLLAAAAVLLFAAPLLPESLRAQGGQGAPGGVAPPAGPGGAAPAGRARRRTAARPGRVKVDGWRRRVARRGGAAPRCQPARRRGTPRAASADRRHSRRKGPVDPATSASRPPLAPPADVPFQPWARALYNDRQKHELEPHARCKASGVSRQFMTPYGVEFVELHGVAAHLHLRRRRPAHVSHHLHGRPHASRRT